MRIFLSPQYNHLQKIEYEFQGEKIIAKIDGLEDEFDFSAMPDGVAEHIETTLPVNPILEANRENGILYVKLLNFIDDDATEKERFPDWQVIE